MSKRHTGRRINSLSVFARTGTKNSFFTNRPKSPFSKIKKVYGEELERFELESTVTDLKSKEFFTQQKKEIRNRVRVQIEKERRQNLVIITCIITLVFLLIIFINYYLLDLIKTYWP